jgi:hypothetical protein
VAIYEVQTEDGKRYSIVTETPVKDGPEGEAQLRRLLAQQIRWREANANTPGALAEQVIGGGRDAVQSWIATPWDIVNTVSELFVSPDPPGPGPRRQIVPTFTAPELAPVAPPFSRTEQVVRTGSQVGVHLLASLLYPSVRKLVSRAIGMGGPVSSVRATPLLFETKRAVAKGGDSPGTWSRLPSTAPRVPTLAEAGEILTRPASEAVQNTARLFGISTDAIKDMTQQQALRTKAEIMSRLGSLETAILREQSTPIAELLDRLDAQLLRYR